MATQQPALTAVMRGAAARLLLLLLLYSGASTANADDDLPTPNNILFLGRGYNIFKGDPHAKTVDPGFEAQVYNLDVYSKGRTTADLRMRVPDGATIVNSEFCRKAFTAMTISKSRSYDSALMSEVTVGGGVAGVAFSASPGFRRIQHETTKSELLVVETTSRCEVYTATMLRNELPPPTRNFVTAMEALPERFDMASPDADLFWRFFRTFGTHVATRISFGSRLSVRHEVLSEALDAFDRRGSSLEMAAEASAQSIYLKVTPKIDRLKADIESYTRLVVSTEILAVGGLANLNRLHDDWRDLTLANDLVPIQYALDPIINHVAPWRRDAIGAALAQFCRAYPNAQCGADAVGAERVCAGAEFADDWAHSSCSLRSPNQWLQVGCGPDHGLGALRLTRSARSRQRYLLAPGCTPLREEDDVADDDRGQYAVPMARRTDRDQEYACADGEFLTGLQLNRACFGDENVAVRCKRSRRPFRGCRWTDAVTDGIPAVPAFVTASCAGGEVVASVLFAANPGADLARQRIRLSCCKFDGDCRQHEDGPFDDGPVPVEPPNDTD